jgi:hypothetical protein
MNLLWIVILAGVSGSLLFKTIAAYGQKIKPDLEDQTLCRIGTCAVLIWINFFITLGLIVDAANVK